MIKFIKRYFLKRKINAFIKFLNNLDKSLQRKGFSRTQRRQFFQNLQTEAGRKYLKKILFKILDKYY